VVLAFIGGIVIVQKQLVVIPQLTTKTWVFLVLSGLATRNIMAFLLQRYQAWPHQRRSPHR
jgi:uncharacterized membrane protein